MSPMPRVRVLTLSHTAADDAALGAVAKTMPNVEVIKAFNTAVTNAGLDALSACSSLQRVYVGQTQVTADAAQHFEQTHGTVECIGDWELTTNASSTSDDAANDTEQSG